MPSNKSLIFLVALFAVSFGLVGTTSPAFAASKEKVLYSFCPSSCTTDGDTPFDTPVIDASGNLYGTAYEGGTNDSGVVWELSPGVGGTWTETVLYNFPNNGGFGPIAGLIFDASGNLYGTTFGGGSAKGGTAFKLTPGKNGWTQQVLHNFGFGKDGWGLSAGLIFDYSSGNLYGTTDEGGINGTGIVFKLMPGANGRWTETVLHNFGRFTGTNTVSDLIFDAAGNLYGTTSLGGGTGCGGGGCGTVFELSPSGNGRWTEKVLHSFNGKNGANPYAVIFDATGNLYGVTYYGGNLGCNPPSGCGVVYELSPGANGKWTEKVLRSFYSKPKYSTSKLVFDGSGNLYGTTAGGGGSGCGGGGCGLVFKLTPEGNGKWAYTWVHSFQEHPEDGNFPKAGLVLESTGNLYGTTYEGGAGIWNTGCGTVFEITP